MTSPRPGRTYDALFQHSVSEPQSRVIHIPCSSSSQQGLLHRPLIEECSFSNHALLLESTSYVTAFDRDDFVESLERVASEIRRRYPNL